MYSPDGEVTPPRTLVLTYPNVSPEKHRYNGPFVLDLERQSRTMVLPLSRQSWRRRCSTCIPPPSSSEIRRKPLGQTGQHLDELHLDWKQGLARLLGLRVPAKSGQGLAPTVSLL